MTISANNGDFAVGTGDFTVEWFQYETDTNSFPRIFSIGTYPSAVLGASLEPTLYVWANNSIATSYSQSKPTRVWKHYAIVRSSGVIKIYMDGTSVASAANTANITNTTTAMSIGTESTRSSNNMYGGALFGFRFTKGLAVYTGNFTRPTGLLTQTAAANPFGGSNTVAIPAGYVKILLNPP